MAIGRIKGEVRTPVAASAEGMLNLIHEYQRKKILKTYSDTNVAAVLFAPVKFMAMNRSVYKDTEEGLAELISMMQDLLLY